MNTIGERIRFLRKRWNMSQARLGEILGVSETAIGNWERGKNQPPANVIPVIADRFKSSCDFILRGV